MVRLDHNSSPHAWRFIAEPILNQNGEVTAMEVLTRFATPGTTQSILTGMTREQKKVLLTEQLIHIKKIRCFFEDKCIQCSVNIDFDMANLLLSEKEMRDIISSCPFIRLEISEDFPDLSFGFKNPLLKKLYELCPLWLDDFGSGLTNFKSLHNGLYEKVKIDKCFFWANYCQPEMNVLIKKIRTYSPGIVIEGIEKESHLEIFTDDDILYQGYLFKHINLSMIKIN